MSENRLLNRIEVNPPIGVLLVDDEATFRINLGKLLTRRGFRVDQAESGAACIDILSAKPVDVVVMDVKMPGMSGIETLHKIQMMDLETEIVLLTGHASARDGVEGIKAGAFDYLTKPVDIDHLAEKIRQAEEKIRLEAERRKAAEFRSQMERQMLATERLASLGTLATGVAHEINNPLAIIKQSAKLMRLILEGKDRFEAPGEPNFDKALTNIENAVERARRITHQLLGFVRKNDAAVAEVDLERVIDDTLEMLRGAMAEKQIEIVREIAPNLEPVRTDPYKLPQVLTNLIINASQACGPGDRVTIRAETDGEAFVLTVQDTGEGIPEENLEKIFEPFFTTKAPGEGTGLGLYVTRGMVYLLGGTITLESRVGEGTRFSVRLPRG